MRSKPSWGFFLIWLIGYTILDMLLEILLHGRAAWRQIPGAVEGAIVGAALTWLFAYRRWLKSDSSF